MKPNRCKRTQATRCSIPVRTQSLKPGTSKTKSRPWALHNTLCHACTEILTHEVQFKEVSSATGPQARQLLCTTFSQDNVLVPTAQAGRSQPHVVTNNTALTNTYTHPLLNCTASSQANVFPTAQACANRMLQQVSNQHSSISHTDPCIHPCQQVDPSTHFTAHLLVKPM